MGLFKKKPKKEQPISQTSNETQPIAYPLRYNGPGPYQMPFKGSGFGVVFEDDGETGYFYATNENMDNIYFGFVNGIPNPAINPADWMSLALIGLTR